MYGVRRCLLRLGTSSLIASTGGIALVFAPYTFTDWYTRGEGAETTGMMLVPWILWWSLDVIRRNRVSFLIVPLVLFTFLAHNLVAFYGLIVTGGAFLIALIANPGRLSLFRRYAGAMALSLAAVVPFLLLIRAFNGDYDISQIVPERLTPKYNLHPLRDYFWAGNFNWTGPDFQNMTVTVGLALWLGLAVVLAWRTFQRLFPTRATRREPFLRREEVFLAAIVMVFMALQTKAFVGVYQLPLFKFIQFPWRLNALITPALIVLVLSVASRCAARRSTAAWAVAGGAGLMVLALVLASPVRSFRPGLVDPETYTPAHIQDAAGSSLGNELVMIGEYLPVVHDGAQREPTDTVSQTYVRLAGQNGGLAVLSGQCTVQAEARTFEASRRTFDLACTGPGTLALPISYSHLSAVHLAGKSLPYHRIDGDPRMIVDVPAGASGKLSVDLPTWWRALRHSIF
jgi:hypothetical protein